METNNIFSLTDSLGVLIFLEHTRELHMKRVKESQQKQNQPHKQTHSLAHAYNYKA